jgi:AbrB family looped-hinge helix DNA binding protein
VVYKLRVGEKGRTVLPAELRDRANIREGDTLLARLEGGYVILESRAGIRARIRAAAAEASTDGGVVDRFLQDRRREAEADDARLAHGDEPAPP